MSELSYLKKLLGGVDVEWLPISKVFDLRNGYTPSKSKKEYWKNGDIPWFRMDDIRENGRILGNSLQRISSCAVKGGKLFPKKSILISTSATIGEHALVTVPHLANQRFTCLTLKVSYIDCFDIKFLFYYCFSLADWCRKNTTMSNFSSVDMDGFRKFLIPLPCPDNREKSFAIQSEIVRILDTFSALTAELTAELTARKKQYNYYRDQLLSFKEGEVEWKTLDYICSSISAGGDVPKNSAKGQIQPTKKYPYPIYANATNEKGLYGYTDSYKIDSDAVTISARGAKVGYHTIREAKFTPIIRLIVLVADKNLLRTRYLNYVLNMTPVGGTDGGIPQITVPMVKKITVPIPFPSDPKKSLIEQDRVVRILDNFETLTNSISEGLPREIKLRQKQYEYYRDLLFSFLKPDAVAN